MTPRVPQRLALVLGLVAIAYGTFAAIRKAWLCDDAFISFRYAENLTHGLGLVFNAGERVEGYSNFLWTLGIALGMRLGVAPERWSIAWGVVFYVATLVLLLEPFFRARGASAGAGESAPPSAAAPIACVLAALHPDWQVYATSGLETSFFTFLVTAGYVLGSRARWGVLGVGGSGLAFALASLTRPDGMLYVPIMILYVLWTRRPRLASVAAFGGVFLAAWLPYAVWKVSYYGEFLPNTYYAKSAYLAWWDQGWTYVSLYFRRYWVLALALPVAGCALVTRARAWGRPRAATAGDADLALMAPVAVPAGNGNSLHALLLALVLGLAYTTYVMRVGGDFMYARLLVPAAPFFVIALARGIELLLAGRPALHWAAAVAVAAGVALTPIPLREGELIRGIADEPRIYRGELVARTRSEGLILRRYFEGLPVRIAFVGTQAALVYYARPAVAIESGSGLTDRWIARQPLTKRGRVGHEKLAPVSYLLQRKVHFTIHSPAGVILGFDKHLPLVPIFFASVPGQMIHWDPTLLAALGRRGARFADLPGELDREIAILDQVGDEQARDAYRRLKAFYFDQVSDPARERAFRERIDPKHRGHLP